MDEVFGTYRVDGCRTRERPVGANAVANSVFQNRCEVSGCVCGGGEGLQRWSAVAMDTIQSVVASQTWSWKRAQPCSSLLVGWPSG
jgi:hypothetical protein